MSVKILDNPVIDERCKTSDHYSPYRLSLYKEMHHDESGYMAALNRVVSGRDVIEIGCGIFGGLSELILDMDYVSYTGIDFTTGDSDRMINGENSFGGVRTMGDRDYLREVPYVVSIPVNVKNDGRNSFVFGKDFMTYLKDEVKDNSVVTISTGFFDEDLLMPDGEGCDYIIEGMRQIARVTISGYPVGMHQFFSDEPEPGTLGIFFKKNFPKFGISVIPIIMGNSEPFCFFMKE